MTGVDKIAKVRLLRFVKGLPIRDIVRQVGLSRNTVRKIIRSEDTAFTYQRSVAHQPITEHYRELIKAWVKEDRTEKKKKRRTAQRIYDILYGGYQYTGSYESVAKCVKLAKEEIGIAEQEVYIPLDFAPGEAFQFDWGEVEAIIKGKLVTLQLAVVQLCHSRHFYVRAYYCQKQELMLDAHRRAFEYFGGTCRRGIYDNLKTAVKKILKGNHRNLQERFVKFSSHYLYEPDFCSPAKGNEKGRVESLVGYVRRNYFIPFPKCDSLEELNDRLISFSMSHAHTHEHMEQAGKTRYAVYQEEISCFIGLKKHGFECCRETCAVVDSCSRIVFDTNWYSVPDDSKGRHVLVRGYAEEIVVSYDGEEIARHRRSFGRKQQILEPRHYLRTLCRKPGALRNGLPFKDWELPEVFNQYRQLLNERYEEGDRYFAKTLVLLKDWTLKEVVEAITKAIDLGVLGESYLLSLLKQEAEGLPIQGDIPINIELSRYSARQKPPEHYDVILRTNKLKVV